MPPHAMRDSATESRNRLTVGGRAETGLPALVRLKCANSVPNRPYISSALTRSADPVFGVPASRFFCWRRLQAQRSDNRNSIARARLESYRPLNNSEMDLPKEPARAAIVFSRVSVRPFSSSKSVLFATPLWMARYVKLQPRDSRRRLIL